MKRFFPFFLIVAVLVASAGALSAFAQTAPTWLTLPLTDAQTGKSFTLADFAGKTIVVEPMATWCSICRAQLRNTTAAIAKLEADKQAENLVFVALSVETNLTADRLAKYAKDNGFPHVFAIMTQDFLRALVAEFGRAAVTPPSSPGFIIRADGTYTSLETGVQSTDEVLAAIAKEIEAAAMPAVIRPAWQAIELTDAVTGEKFSLADYDGKAVYVEAMATWCSNCRRQLANVTAAIAKVTDEPYVFVALSVETNLKPEDLKAYQERTGYTLRFAVAPDALLRQLVEQFGRTIVNPPSTPAFIIRPDGSFTELTTGFKTPERVLEELAAAVAKK